MNRPRGREKKPVICLTTGEIYDSVKAAALALGISYAGVSIAVIQDKIVKGFAFKEYQLCK